jgi:DNA polymerase-3 subunit gamma/tau
LAEVCRQEKIKAEPEALTMVARLADGSMRDAQTLLDRVQTYCAGSITAAETSQALGSVERAALTTLTGHILKRDVVEVLTSVGEIFSTGIDPATLLKEFSHFWREVFIAKLGGEARLKTLGMGDESVVDLVRLVAGLDAIDVQDLWDLARDGADRCIRSANPRYGFEALVVRMATRQSMRDIGEFLGQVGAKTDNTSPHPAVAKAKSATPAPRPQLKAPAGSDSTRTAAPVSPPAVGVQSAAPQRPLQWESFLSYVGDNSGRILLENLKRMKPIRFEVGVLEATGPEFTVTSLIREKNKLCELLASFAGEGKGAMQWKLSLQKGASADDGTGQGVVKSQAQKVEALESHPALQSLQKIFPGSKVEQVRTKN